MQTHLSPHRLTPESLVLVPPAFRGFLLEMSMAIMLPNAFRTDVYGTGDGYIVLKQENSAGEVSVVYLTLNQFQTILNNENHLTQEALNAD